jgi:hypothetical protein
MFVVTASNFVLIISLSLLLLVRAYGSCNARGYAYYGSDDWKAHGKIR